MSQPKLITKPFASDALPGYVNEIPKENPVGAPEQNASWSEGFPPITMTDIDDGGLPPNGEDMNGVLRAITEHNLFIGGGGVYEFTDDYITEVGGYSKGAVLISDDKTALWMSIQDNNTQNFNGATKNQWRQIAFTELDSTLASVQNALNTKADKSVTITAGDGLTGGGTLAGNRVLAVNSSVVRTDRTITAGTGLSGGGNLSTNRTLSVNYGTTAGTAAQGNDSRITGAAQKSANLSDLVNAGAARQNLGLGTAATRDVGTDSGDIMEVGAFGLGSAPVAWAPDLNVGFPQKTAFFRWTKSATNAPYPFGVGIYIARSSDLFDGHRLLFGYEQNRAWLQARKQSVDEFLPAVELLSSGNILSATGQSTQYPMTQKAVTDALNTKANTSTQVIAGTGLSGGGNLSANRTLSVNYGTTAGTAAQGNDSRITGAAQKSANLSDLVNAGAARQNLGLGTAATRNVGTDSGDIMEVGAFGLGAVGTNWSADNVPVGNRFLSKLNGTAGSPFSPAGGCIIEQKYSTGAWGSQLFVGNGDNLRVGFRGYNSARSSWSDWFEFCHTGNILHTTGQSTQYPMTQKAVTDALDTKVDLTGNQAIAGTKTFSTFPVTPSAAPTDNYQVANKKYVDDNALGVGQTWQNVTGSRVAGTTYTNSTGKPIQIQIAVDSRSGDYFAVGGIQTSLSDAANATIVINTVIPVGATYMLSGWATLKIWMELR